MKTTKVVKPNVFTDALAVGGLDDIFSSDGGLTLLQVPLDLIDIEKQIREEFDDADNTVGELAASIMKLGVLQPIVIRPSGERYLLVAGERRMRASKLAGLDSIPAHVKHMNDQEAADAQFAENVQRKNLTLLEEAKRLNALLSSLGSIDAVCTHENKSAPWVSKRLSLLSLPTEAKRLIKENISADPDVIHAVKTVEKRDPVLAKATVDKLKETRGKASARDIAQQAKDQVKPKRVGPLVKSETPLAPGPAWLDEQRKKDYSEVQPTVAAPRDRSAIEPGAVSIAVAAPSAQQFLSLSDVALEELNRAYFDAENGDVAGSVKRLVHRREIDDSLGAIHVSGTHCGDAVAEILSGLRNGEFSADGAAAVALGAFLTGMVGEPYSLERLLQAIEPATQTN
jgi:ParB family transcriptional regulator, chromosome partitioning protein